MTKVANNVKLALAAAIRAERARARLSQQDLADCVGVSRSTVSDWENGAESPRHDHLVLMSGAFKKAVHEWMPG